MRELNTLGRCWAERIEQVSTRGTPDILGCVNGRFVALEAKKDAFTDANDLQRWKLRCIEGAGGFSRVICPENWEEVLKELRFLERKK